MRSRLWILAVCVLLGAFGCRAGAVRPDAEPSGYSDLSEEPPISLVRAIGLARERFPGGIFLHAELGQPDGRADCLVLFLGAHGLHFLTLDATNGELLNEGYGGDYDPEEGAALLGKAADSLGSCIEPEKAVEIAVAAVPGSWARLINLEGDVDPLVYLVEVVAGEGERYVRIGAVDGKVLSVRTDNELPGEPETDD
jgi:uncharacterized membrane protein YkoI